MVDFTFIHAADIHLDSPLRGLSKYEGAPVDLLRHAPRAALKNLVTRAIEEKVNFIIIAGDLYDGKKQDINTGLFFARQMSRLKSEGIQVFLVYGNHDAQSKITSQIPWPDNVIIFPHKKADTHHLHSLFVAIHGQSFKEAKTTSNLAASYPDAISGYFNIGILHTALEGHAEHASYAPCSIQDLEAKEYDYWALGHVHEHKVVQENPLIAYPGNLQGRHSRETGPRGALLVTVTDNIPSTERLILDTLRWEHLNIDISNAQNTEDVSKAVGERFELLLSEHHDDDILFALRITLSGQTEAHGALLGYEKQLRHDILAHAVALDSEHLWIEKIIIETKPPLDKESIRQRSGAIADLQSYLDDACQDEELHKIITDEIDVLKGKLNSEVRESVPEFDKLQEENLSSYLEETAQGIIARLTHSDAGAQ